MVVGMIDGDNDDDLVEVMKWHHSCDDGGNVHGDDW